MMTTTNTNAPAAPMLPGWLDSVRAMPNSILRSAIFGVIRKGKRRDLKSETLASIGGLKVIYTGERLDQGDLDVYMSILHTLQSQPLGIDCQVTGSSLLNACGLTNTGKNREILKSRITRLMACALAIESEHYSYAGSLISDAAQDKRTGRWVITLNLKLAGLFGDDQYTNVDWEARRSLAGKPLAQWLHGFYSTHAKPYPMRIDTLLTLSGCENINPRSSRQVLRNALDAVTQVNGAEFSYTIQDDLVRVQMMPSGSQIRHILKSKKVRKQVNVPAHAEIRSSTCRNTFQHMPKYVPAHAKRPC